MTQHLWQNLHTNVILEHFLHLLEHWLGQKPGRTHRTMTARRGIIYFRGDQVRINKLKSCKNSVQSAKRALNRLLRTSSTK